MDHISIELQPGKKLYFASDFHLGAGHVSSNKKRETQVVNWLNQIKPTAQALFLLGDVFDFWYEYRHVAPKGFVRLLGKLAEFTDQGIPVYLFHGNHDMWLKDYLPKEIGVQIYPDQLVVGCAEKKLLIGHGDGLGPGDHTYKLLKKVFRNPVAKWLFGWMHPTVGFAIANKWSAGSRIRSEKNNEEFLGEDEWLWIYCKEVEEKTHHDYYVFGHRHLSMELPVGASATYFNLGEWVHNPHYAVFDGEMKLVRYEG